MKKVKSLLEKSCIDMNEYKSAYEFINKCFSIIPYQNIKNKNQLMTSSSKYHELTKQIENNFKNIFENEDEYENVLNELIKTPYSDTLLNLLISIMNLNMKLMNWN